MLSCDVTWRDPRLSHDGLFSRCSCLQTRDDQETRTQCSKEFEPYPSEHKLFLYYYLSSLGYLIHRWSYFPTRNRPRCQHRLRGVMGDYEDDG